MYAKVSNNKIVNYPANPWADHPHIGFPENWNGGTVNGDKYVVVKNVAVPVVGPYEKYVESTPICITGTWNQTYTVETFNNEEENALKAILFEQLKIDRNNKLSNCDWTQLPDTPLSPKLVLSWKTYRQQLRDLPANTIDPAHVSWPIEPQ